MKRIDFVGKTKKLKRIFDVLFPTKGGFDFSKVRPEELFAELPKCKNLRGASALEGLPDKSAFAALSYRHKIVRSLVWQIKFQRNQDALRCGGYFLQRTVSELFELLAKIENQEKQKKQKSVREPIIIIPMPVSSARRRERGYNQCELLAKAMAEWSDASSVKIELRTDILFRIKNVKKQTFKNRQERMENMHGVFEVRQDRNGNDFSDIRDRTIIILDDVITTGSTLREAIDCMRKTGFKNITGLSLAH